MMSLASCIRVPLPLVPCSPLSRRGSLSSNFFPDRYYAIAIPVFAGVLLLAATLVTLGGFLLASELSRWAGGAQGLMLT